MSASYLDTQEGKVTELIKNAIVSEIPIIYLVTDEISLLYKIIDECQIIEPIFSAKRKEVGNHNGVKFTTATTLGPNVFFSLAEFGAWLEHPKYPAIAIVQDDTVVFDRDNLTFSQELYDNISRFLKMYQRAVHVDGNYENIRQSTIIIATPTSPIIPKLFAPYVRVINAPLIKYSELRMELSQLVRKLDGIEMHKGKGTLIGDEEYLDCIERYISGLSKSKIRQIFRNIKDQLGYVYFSGGTTNKKHEKVIEIIQKEKKEIIANSGILKLTDCSKVHNINGMSEMTEWLYEMKGIIREYDKAKWISGVQPLKGVLVSGIPGSGKSLLAKATANILNLPLISMDMGLIRGKYVGESEHRMNEAFRQIEALSPCVVWIDEIEKAMGNSDGDETGVSKRLLGQFLTWMQEKESKGVCCFVFATANDISGIPPELFRNGRFDAKFYTFMPSVDECDAIFTGIINKQNKEHSEKAEQARCGKKLDDISPNIVASNPLPESLYAKNICQKGFFKEILNSLFSSNEKEVRRLIEAYKLEDFYEHQLKKLGSRKTPFTIDDLVQKFSSSNKFLTGADIEAVIEHAKRKLYCTKMLDEKCCIFSEDNFRKQIVLSLAMVKTYGETNADDIAKTFISLKKNNFTPAGDKPIISLDDFDLDTGKINDGKSQVEDAYDIKLMNLVKTRVEKMMGEAEEARKAISKN